MKRVLHAASLAAVLSAGMAHNAHAAGAGRISGPGLSTVRAAGRIGPRLGRSMPSSLRPASAPGLPLSSIRASLGAAASAQGASRSAAVATGRTGQSLSRIGSAMESALNRSETGERAAALAADGFDGGDSRGPGSGGANFRSPDDREDGYINSALEALGRSKVGVDVYRQVYKQHGVNLTIHIDDDPNASYDARLVRQDGRPRIYLTQGLVRNASPEAVAAYLAREMSDLYFEDFPESAERGYMAYSMMVRSFAEMTNSDLNSHDGAWDSSRDQRSGGVYVIERLYDNWKEAVTRHSDVRNSAFFAFLQTRDDSNVGVRSKMSLRQQYDQGLITYSHYSEMDRYFMKNVQSEERWLRDTGRR